MFHFPHDVHVLQKPTGESTFGDIIYTDVTKNIRCQFLGLPTQNQINEPFGEHQVEIGQFSFPFKVKLEPQWRFIIDNVAWIVMTSSPLMTLAAKPTCNIVMARKELIKDGSTSWKDIQ